MEINEVNRSGSMRIVDQVAPISFIPVQLASSGLHYIPVPKSKIKQWQSKIQKLCPGPNIGLVWRGSPNHLRDSLRSIKLELFEPLLDLENVNLFFLLSHSKIQHCTLGDSVITAILLLPISTKCLGLILFLKKI